MPRKQPRSISISLRDRGQTTQDFAVGIGVFLLAIAFVFSFLPTFITPFASDVGPAETAQADRIASTIVDNLSENSDRPNHFTRDTFENRFTNDNTSKLSTELGLRTAGDDPTDRIPIDRVNVSIEELNQSRDYSERLITGEGERYDENRTAASAARIVTVDFDNSAEQARCDPACRLVVRVW